jgi:hypothetical protein
VFVEGGSFDDRAFRLFVAAGPNARVLIKVRSYLQKLTMDFFDRACHVHFLATRKGFYVYMERQNLMTQNMGFETTHLTTSYIQVGLWNKLHGVVLLPVP